MTTDQPRMSCFIQLEGKDQIKEKKKKKKKESIEISFHFISFQFIEFPISIPFHLFVRSFPVRSRLVCQVRQSGFISISISVES